ncbi:MAG TPA: phosphohistidine phosphatase SixA [Armatimonadota bacterium]|jgi:phosphohistidine phosphatase
MDLYFLRHADAESQQPGQDDSDRELTAKGLEQARGAAGWLRSLGVEVEAVICSPRVRAQQTAAPVGEALGRAVQLDDRLDGGGLDAAALRGLLADARIGDSAVLVGHEPDFSEILEALTGGQVEMKKAAVALVRVEGFRARGGVLIWLAPPKLHR